MILISSNKYQSIKQKLKEAQGMCGCVSGAERVDDERLTKLDVLLDEIESLLHPATDER